MPVGISLTGLTPPHLCACPRTCISNFIYCGVFFVFSELSWEVVVRFVDIGGIVDHHCLIFPCFVDIGGIVDHHCLIFPCFKKNCWYWWNCWLSLFNLSLFCWYWWNCWPSLFNLSLFCWYWWNCWPSLF